MQMNLNQNNGTTPAELQAAKFINRSYGDYNVKPGYFYPESPYALHDTRRNALTKKQQPGIGDLVFMGVPACANPAQQCGSMQVFPGTLSLVQDVTPSSLLPGADDQGNFPASPNAPAGIVTSDLPNSAANVPSVIASVTQSAGGSNAPVSIAPSPSTAQPGQSIAPITLVGPMPSILRPSSKYVQPHQLACEAPWIAQHPLLSIGIAAGVFMLVRGMR